MNCFIWHFLRVSEERNQESNLINCKSSSLGLKRLKVFFVCFCFYVTDLCLIPISLKGYVIPILELY